MRSIPTLQNRFLTDETANAAERLNFFDAAREERKQADIH
jgi:hypothetical protein